MAREAIIELNCIYDLKDIMLLIDLLCNDGWTVYNLNSRVEYLPIGDDEDFCWREDNISYEKLRNIVKTKQQRNEFVGIHLFYKESPHGISLLSRDAQRVTVSLDINRKTIGDGRNSLTNFEWYFSKIIMVLNKENNILASYRFEDYID